MGNSSKTQWQLDQIHDDGSSAVVTSHAVVLPLAVIAATLKFVFRLMCRASIEADDYMIIIALAKRPAQNDQTIHLLRYFILKC